MTDEMKTLLDDVNQKPGGYITEISFNNGESLSIKKNDIVVFVGPNNSGKSQSLSDIFTLCEDQKKTSIVIKKLHIQKCKKDILTEFLQGISIVQNNGGYTQYLGYNYNFSSIQLNDFNITSDLGGTRNLFISYLNTETRLSICNPPDAINRNEVKKHPIHYAAFIPAYRKMLTKNFKKAFGLDVTPNTQFGRNVPLCIGQAVQLEGEFADEQERQEEYAKRLSDYKQVHKQGDGIRSFTGILLNLMINYYRTFLIDEPESFLHPPQASIMGRVIGETLNDDQQAFISTHSQEIVRGLLDVCPDRIKIVRITRKEDTNFFSVLENEMVKHIWKDPLLKHSNIMSSMFHQTVVLCESDSDCKMYSIIHSHLKEKSGEYSEALFIHCGGKHRMPQIIVALKSLKVDIRVIADIDVLNDEIVIQGIVESIGGTWGALKREYSILSANLQSQKEKLARLSVAQDINDLLKRKDDRFLDKGEVESMRSILKTTTKWSELKSSGIAAIPAGDAKKAYNVLSDKLKEIGVFVVPCGELECFVKEIGRHGPEWVNAVLETYPNFDDPIYEQVKQFVSSWNI